MVRLGQVRLRLETLLSRYIVADKWVLMRNLHFHGKFDFSPFFLEISLIFYFKTKNWHFWRQKLKKWWNLRHFGKMFWKICRFRHFRAKNSFFDNFREIPWIFNCRTLTFSRQKFENIVKSRQFLKEFWKFFEKFRVSTAKNH